jgi:hypothetical protein
LYHSYFLEPPTGQISGALRFGAVRMSIRMQDEPPGCSKSGWPGGTLSKSAWLAIHEAPARAEPHS